MNRNRLKLLSEASIVLLIGAVLATTGCTRNQPPKIGQLPNVVNMETNQNYGLDLSNYATDDGICGKMLYWTIDMPDKRFVLFAQINLPHFLVIKSGDEFGSATFLLTVHDADGLTDSQEMTIVVSRSGAEGESEGEGELPGEGEGEGGFVGITIFGDKYMVMEAGKEFIDPGAVAYDAYDGPLPVTVTSNVDTSRVGIYTVIYTATDSSGNTAQAVRTVEVIDTTPPVIAIKGDNPAVANINVEYRDAGAIVTDNCGGIISVSVENTVDTSAFGIYLVTYTATDAHGNTSQAVRTVEVTDALAPVITIIGSNPTATVLGGTYTDEGATALDNYDGNVTANITTVNNVNSAVEGTYTVTYTVTDSYGNIAQAVRTVRVEPVAIIVTVIPEYGTTQNLQGSVTGIDPARHHIAVYIRVEDWWTKPTFANPTVNINSDGTFWCDFTTGGNDIYATEIALYLLPIEIDPPQCGPCVVLPDMPEALDFLLIDRSPPVRTISFAGRLWKIKYAMDHPFGPGPNFFSDLETSVWVDAEGVHLTIIQDGFIWYCSEIIGTESLGYGTYVFSTIRRVDLLDPNVIFGAFTWDPTSPETFFNELDVEIAKWGIPNLETKGQVVIQPCSSCLVSNDRCHRFDFNLTETEQELTYYMVWQPTYVEWRVYYGTYGLAEPPPIENLVSGWTYVGGDIPVPNNETFRFNLWLLDGLAPTDSQNVEVVVTDFNYQVDPMVWSLDATPPVITILGDNPATAEAMQAYADTGATAIDDVDGDISASIVVISTVNTSLLGSYTVSYAATDSSGNTAQATRTVEVVDTTPPVITIDGNEWETVPVENPVGENLPVEITLTGLGAYIIGDSYQNYSRVDTAIAVDSQGQVHLIYRSGSGLVYVNNVGGVWQKVNSWSPYTISGSYCSLALDSQDYVYISAVGSGGGAGEDLISVNNAGGTWVMQAVDTAASVGLENHIIATGNGAAIGYYDWAGAKLRLAIYQSGSWEIFILDDAGLVPISIIMDTLGTLHLIYFSGNIKHITNASGDWVSEAILFASSSGGVSAAMDANDKLHVATPYYGLSSNATGSWVQEDIFALLLPGVSRNYIRLDEDALVIDNQGYLHLCFLVSYPLGGGVYDRTICYASNIFGYWEMALVDCWYASSSYALAPSLTMDNNGNAHVVYVNTADWKVRYTTFDPTVFLGG